MAPRTKPKALAPPLPAALASPPSDDDNDPTFLDYLSTNKALGIDPLSDEGLRMQAQFIMNVGAHPLDVLRNVMQNMFAKPAERVAAAKAILEYGARKVPAQLEVMGKNGAPLTVHSDQLKALSTKELDQLQALLAKTQVLGG